MSNPRKYVDFKLYLTKAAGNADLFQVSLLPTPEVGESIEPVQFSIGEGAYAAHKDNLKNRQISNMNLAKVGKQLAEWLLPEKGGIRRLFDNALTHAGSDGGVRLRLIIANHALKKIPWEFVYNPLVDDDDATSALDFLALNPRISIVRHDPINLPHRNGIEPTGPVTRLGLLAASASPKGAPEIAVGRELADLRTALGKESAEHIALDLACIEDARWEEVTSELIQNRGAYQLFHFAGHGVVDERLNSFDSKMIDEGQLIFADKRNNARPVSFADFATQMEAADMRLVTLGACQGADRHVEQPWHSVAGALIKRNIPVVVAMQYEIGDRAAITFSKAFYGQLENGLSLDEAMSWSRYQMAERLIGKDSGRGNMEWGVPVLYSRLPDGVFVPEFEVPDEAKAAAVREEMNNVITINQKFGTIEGENVGADIEGAQDINQDIVVNQSADTIAKGGKNTGLRLNFSKK